MSIEFSVCENCGRPIFFDWKGTHHVREGTTVLLWADYSKPECSSPSEGSEDE